MKKAIVKYFKFWLMQRKWGRKYIGGKFYLISTVQLGLAPFWSDTEITSCQSKTLDVEIYAPPLIN
jgi:hypothetical protein